MKKTLRVKPEKACKLIVVCVIRHNVARLLQDEWEDEEEFQQEDNEEAHEVAADQEVIVRRDAIINFDMFMSNHTRSHDPYHEDPHPS